MNGHTGIATLTGFGDPADSTTFAFFHVQRDPNSGVYPDWEAEEHITVRHYAGTSNNDVFAGGFGPDEITLSLWFDDQERYDLFRAKRQTTGTLRLINGFTSISGTPWHDGGVDYVLYDNVFLRSPRHVLHRVGGIVECEATFILLGGT